MVEPPACLHVPGDVRVKTLPRRGDPVDDGTLHPLRVVGPGTIGAFLDLEILLYYEFSMVKMGNRSLNQQCR